MKTLLTLTLIAVAAITDSSRMLHSNNQDLAMQLASEMEFEEKVRVYSYQGALLKEFLLSDVVNNEISVTDHLVLEESDFAFDYLGDYYYFSKELDGIGIN